KSMLFSNTTTIILLFTLVVVIAIATFIENSFDTITTKLLIYNTKWFEALLVLLTFNFIGNINRSKLFRKEKLASLILHVAFITMIIGAGVTRYFGFEANMHILNNESVNTIYSSEPYINFKLKDNDELHSSENPIYFSQIEDNSFQLEFKIEKSVELKIALKNYILNDVSKNNNTDEIILDLIYQSKTYTVSLFYDKSRYSQEYKSFNLDGLEIELYYGPKPMELPFEIKLNKFVLSKYPGTNLPSASESHITLIDKRNHNTENHIIAKNKVLDYDGYRFFQTSYDDDENGTILSVNYDYYGTRITYFAYFLLLLGSLLILFSKKTYFTRLNKKIKETRDKRKSLFIALLFVIGFNTFAFSQNSIQKPISKEHADKFGYLIVQNYDGRFSPVHSLAEDVIHKISGKNKIISDEKGELDAMQAFHDILVDPDYWKNQKIIKVNSSSISDLIGIKGKYASFNDFLTNTGEYKLEALALNAFQKKESIRTKFDKDIIKLTDRIRVFYMATNGSFLKIFPVQDSENNNWINWIDSLAFKPLHGELLFLNEDLQHPDFTYSNLMRSYLISTIYARKSEDYTTPDKHLRYFNSIQRQIAPEEIIPSKGKIKTEVFYNKLRIFDLLKYSYGLFGAILIMLALFKDFRLISNNKLNLPIKIFSLLIITGFLFQTLGLILRWYLSGHAPWSNGYEVLIFVSWNSVLAGLFVFNQSKITLASTAILSSVLLLIAGLSYYDPQLTNLTPVLKSYWLIIHVAVITIGYGFLALSFILGLLNLVIKVLQKNNSKIHELIFEELTYINEKFLTIGLFFTAIGTFLGGVWANETWGRYWGWDPKETWSLIIVLTYGLVLHLKFIPKMKSLLTFNIASVISFFTVIMTFVGLNFYFKNSLHSYAT
ncbi:MAG: hypothetical protein C0597_01280, partial [Marinilabiliales bacterium]